MNEYDGSNTLFCGDEVIEHFVLGEAVDPTCSSYNVFFSLLQTRESDIDNMSHSQMLGKFEYGQGPIFKVVLEC